MVKVMKSTERARARARLTDGVVVGEVFLSD